MGTWEAANNTTLPVVNLLIFPVKIFPVNVVGGVKLLPCTVIGTAAEFAPDVDPEFTNADAGLIVEMLGVVKPTLKSLLRLFSLMITIVLPPGDTV